MTDRNQSDEAQTGADQEPKTVNPLPPTHPRDVSAGIGVDQVPKTVNPLPPIHHRDVSALTDIGDLNATMKAGNTSSSQSPPSLASVRHRRGVSVDLTRRHIMPRKTEPSPLKPVNPPRAREVVSSGVKKSQWGAASKFDAKVVGLGEGARYSAGHYQNEKGLSASLASRHKRESAGTLRTSIDEEERMVREEAESSPFKLLIIGGIAAVKVFGVYLITLDTLLSISLSVGLCCYWYFTNEGAPESSWEGGGMDWVLLGFAVVTPLSMAIGIAYRRRERALIDISRFKSFAYQIYLAHSLWDWGKPPNAGRSATNCDWLRHTDSVLEQLIGIGDELFRFLTLPTYSRTRHRMMKSGRREAARTVEVAYRLFDSLYTQRIMKLTMLTEAFKYEGLNHSEASRIRQYERFLGEAIEDLRVIKTYRTPQALRAFGRIFTVFLPPFYAPSFAQLAFDLNSLVMGIAMAIITPLCLTALFESIQVLEDPFVGYITLDGIDVREELQVLLWQQLVNARKIIFPYAPPFHAGAPPPVMWEIVTEEISPGELTYSTHSSDVTEPAENKEMDLENVEELISIQDIEMGYSSEDPSIDMRTSNFNREPTFAALLGSPESLGASWRSMRRRLPSVDSVRNVNDSPSQTCKKAPDMNQ